MSASSLEREVEPSIAGGPERPSEVGEDSRSSTVRPPSRKRKGRFTGRRARKPKQLAVILDGCTGCAGAPVCQTYCPVEECMILIPARDATPYGRIWVDPLKCVGCLKCVRQGPEESFLDGCPWDAIVMVPTGEWEKIHGELAY